MRYEKPIVNVIDLQVKENIAANDGTVYRAGATGGMSQGDVTSLALTQTNTGISGTADGLVSES